MHLTELIIMAQLSLFDDLSEIYTDMIGGLDSIDQSIYQKHKENFQCVKTLAHFIELGADLHARMRYLDSAGEPEKADNLVEALSVLLGLSGKSIIQAEKLVSLIGEVTLRQVVKEAESKKMRISFSQLKELNRISLDEFTDQRNEVLRDIREGKLLTHTQVQSRVSTIISKSSPQLTLHDGDSDSSVAPSSGDALDEAAPRSDLDKMFSKISSITDGYFDKVKSVLDSLQRWREDATIQTLQALEIEGFCVHRNNLDDLCVILKDLSISINDIIQTCEAARSEAA